MVAVAAVAGRVERKSRIGNYGLLPSGEGAVQEVLEVTASRATVRPDAEATTSRCGQGRAADLVSRSLIRDHDPIHLHVAWGSAHTRNDVDRESGGGLVRVGDFTRRPLRT